MSLSMIMSCLMTLIGVIYLGSTLTLPSAKIGNPQEPKIFPGILGVAMVVLGAILIFQELKRRPVTDEEKAKSKLQFGATEMAIVFTVLNGALYTLLFNHIGYVFSTIVFLELQLIIFRGKKTWLNSLLISVVFSVCAFLLFDTALGIYLPTSALGII